MPPRISTDEAIEIARAECERRGHSFSEPIHVRRGPFEIRVRTRADRIGGNVHVRIKARSGEVVGFAFFKR